MRRYSRLLIAVSLAAFVAPRASTAGPTSWAGSVSAKGCTTYTDALVPGVYTIKVTGDFQYRDFVQHRSDAMYSTTDSWSSHFSSGRGLGVNGKKQNWGSYNKDHVYVLQLDLQAPPGNQVLPGNPYVHPDPAEDPLHPLQIALSVIDDACGSSDNTGSLSVKVWLTQTPEP